MTQIPLSLYIHIPWCVRKCPYCDFHSYAIQEPIPETDYVTALLADLAQDIQKVSNRQIKTIFIGGGTPSVLAPATIAHLLDGIRAQMSVAATAEITLEANPGTVDNARFCELRQAGVNRLSIGIQSFQDPLLQTLGRIHGRHEALQALTAVHNVGFTNFNCDLMFGLPGQTVAAALDDLHTAIAGQPPHLSWYQLTIEPNTSFYQQPPSLPDEDTVWEIYTAGQSYLKEHGYEQYEISAYTANARYCQHNLNYWQFGDYLGIGAGAHSKITTTSDTGLTITRFRKKNHPADYMNTASTAAVIDHAHILSTEEISLEFMMNALRVLKGFTPAQFTLTTGLPLAAIAEPLEQAYRYGWLTQDGHAIRTTALGLRYLNNVLELF